MFRTVDAPQGLLEDARALVFAAFSSGFTEDDWDHALGGWHAVVVHGERVVSHAAVISRDLEVGERKFTVGYVEGVATGRALRGQGYGSRAMTEIGRIIRRNFELGALSSDAHAFYERLGWERWRGPTFVRSATGLVRTEDDDDGIMVLCFGPSAGIALTDPISCEERRGDVW